MKKHVPKHMTKTAICGMSQAKKAEYDDGKLRASNSKCGEKKGGFVSQVSNWEGDSGRFALKSHGVWGSPLRPGCTPRDI